MASVRVWRVLLPLLLGWGAYRLVDAHRLREDRCWDEDRCPVPFAGRRGCGFTNEGEARRGLRELAAGQALYQAGRRGTWRADIAGLHLNEGSPEGWPKRITPSLALADAAPSVDLARAGEPQSFSGYRFRALRHAGEVQLSPNRWAAAALPEPGVGSCVLVIDERGEIWHAPVARVGTPDRFPTGPELARDWRQPGEPRPFDGMRVALLAVGSFIGVFLTVYAMSPVATPGAVSLALVGVALMPLAALFVHPWLAWRGVRWGVSRWAGPQRDLFMRLGLGIALTPVSGALALALVLLAAAAGLWWAG
jgi:hypothetical protein